MVEAYKGNRKGAEEMVERPKHVSAHAAIEPQSAIDLSHGLALGQQSDISSAADMSPEVNIAAISGDFAGNAAPPATGSIATEIATTSASIVRPRFMVLWVV